MKKVLLSLISAITILAVPVTTYAHVVVKPAEVAPGAFQTFTTGVPNEKDVPVTGLRVVIPEGVMHVSPNVKPGWQIKITKSGDGEDAKVTEIEWTGGSIPAGQRDDFVFSAQAPATASTINWKAYQTYQDGTVVAWDKDPAAAKDSDESSTPYSQTKVAEPTKDDAGDSSTKQDQRANVAIALSAVALVFVIALPAMRRKK
jgi:uncharacterized protein YcnI